MAAERNSKFWNSLELKADDIQKGWENVVEEIDGSFFTMDGILEEDVERETTRIVIVAPMLDLYIKEIGQGFLSKLGRGRNTGYHSLAPILIPWQIFTSLLRLVKRYGGSYSFVQKKNKEKTFTLTISSEASVRKIWHPVRIGKVYLAKRKFQRVKEVAEDGTESLQSRFSGVAKVVVGANAPVTLSYYTKTQKCNGSFFIQRYDKDMMAMDAHVQTLLNE